MSAKRSKEEEHDDEHVSNEAPKKTKVEPKTEEDETLQDFGIHQPESMKELFDDMKITMTKEQLTFICKNLDMIGRTFEVDQDDIEDSLWSFAENQPNSITLDLLLDSTIENFKNVFSSLTEALIECRLMEEWLFVKDCATLPPFSKLKLEHHANPWAIMGSQADKALKQQLLNDLKVLSLEKQTELTERWFAHFVGNDDEEDFIDFETTDLSAFKFELDPEIFNFYPSNSSILKFLKANKPPLLPKLGTLGTILCSACNCDLMTSFNISCAGCKRAFTEHPKHFWPLQPKQFQEARKKFIGHFQCCLCPKRATFSTFTAHRCPYNDGQKYAYPWCSEECLYEKEDIGPNCWTNFTE